MKRGRVSVDIDGLITAKIQRSMEVREAGIVAFIQEEEPEYESESDPSSIADFCQGEISVIFQDADLAERVRKCMAGEASWLVADVITLEIYYFNHDGFPVLSEVSRASEEAQSDLNEIPELPF